MHKWLVVALRADGNTLFDIEIEADKYFVDDEHGFLHLLDNSGSKLVATFARWIYIKKI